MAIKVGNIKEQQEKMRGWLCGQFFPEESPFRTDKMEIYCKKFAKGDKSDKLHKHPIGTEFLIVIEGKMKFRIGDEVVILEKGSYVRIPENTPDQIVEVLEDLMIIGVRTPSVTDNKVLLVE